MSTAKRKNNKRSRSKRITQEVSINTLQHLRFASTPDSWDLERRVEATGSINVRDENINETLVFVAPDNSDIEEEEDDGIIIIAEPMEDNTFKVIHDLTEWEQSAIISK